MEVIWNYENISGNFWNKLPIDTQMKYLKEYYPIDYIFHKIQPNHNNPSSTIDWFKYECVIESYVLLNSWYILRIKNINNPYVNSEYEQIHPGFFRPGKWYYRNKKLELLLN